MRNVVRTLNPQNASASGYATAQAGLANQPLALNGALVTGGVGKPDVARRVGITSAGNDSGITFTIVGSARAEQGGAALTETIAGANIGTAVSTQDFATVTSITPSGNTAGNVNAGTTSTVSDAWIPVDQNQTDFQLSAVVVWVSGAYQVEYTYDDVFALLATGKAPFPTALTAQTPAALKGPATATGDGFFNDPVRAIRLTETTPGNMTMTVVQQGAGR